MGLLGINDIDGKWIGGGRTGNGRCRTKLGSTGEGVQRRGDGTTSDGVSWGVDMPSHGGHGYFGSGNDDRAIVLVLDVIAS